MKRLTIAILICVLFASLTFAAAANNHSNADITVENAYQSTSEEINYSINNLSVKSVAGVTRSANENNLLSFEISVSSDTAFEMAAPPKIALDEDFNQPVSINNITIEENTGNTSTEETILSIEAYCDNSVDSIYVQMPIISRVSETEIVEKNVHFSEAIEYSNTVDGKEIHMFALPFDAEEFSVAPRTITLDTGEQIESLISDMYLDDDGNIVSGYFVFVKPDNYTVLDTYDVVVTGVFENLTPVVATVNFE